MTSWRAHIDTITRVHAEAQHANFATSIISISYAAASVNTLGLENVHSRGSSTT